MANDFVTFAGGAGANVYTTAQYLALNSGNYVANGNQTGIADSKAVNKAQRQSSIMAAVLAQLIVDWSGQNAVDDGTTTTLLTNLKTALAGQLIKSTLITATGSFTPDARASKTRVRLTGGGGAGGGAVVTGAGQVSIGSGGGCGSYAEILILSKITGAQAVTVGSGGTGVSGAAGNAGGSSQFSVYVTAPGGVGGGTAAAGAGPYLAVGGSNGTSPTVGGGSTTVLSLPGVAGGAGFVLGVASAGQYSPGRGSANALGLAGAPVVGYGSGGNGASSPPSSAASAGTSGTAGSIIVEEYT